MTTYQKLKAENLLLRQELITVATRPQTMEAAGIINKYQLLDAQERSVWLGSLNTKENERTNSNGFLTL